MGPQSGRFGVIDGISTVRNWSINDVSTLPKGVASSTKNGALRRPGIRSWTGSFAFYGHTPPVMPGSLFDFAGYTAPNDGVSGNGVVYLGQAICDSASIVWNWQSGDIISGTCNFSGHLELTTDVDEYLDTTSPNAPSICGTGIFYNATEWENVTQATLNLTAANGSYVNSSTGCWTGRRPGPVDATLSVVEQEVARGSFEIGDDLIVKIMVDGTDFWELKWMKVKDFSGLSVDRETGAIMSRTVALEKNGFNGGTGWIKKPGGTTWWPA